MVDILDADALLEQQKTVEAVFESAIRAISDETNEHVVSAAFSLLQVTVFQLEHFGERDKISLILLLRAWADFLENRTDKTMEAYDAACFNLLKELEKAVLKSTQ